MDESHIIKKLIKQHGTNDPMRIASDKKILVIREWLGLNLRGYFSNVNRIRIIHINEELDDFKTKYTAAHELAHSILHPTVNTPFLKKNTLFSIDRIEIEANRFAVSLLVGENSPEYDEMKSRFLLRCDIPEWLHKFY